MLLILGKLCFKLLGNYWKQVVHQINKITCEWFDHEYEYRTTNDGECEVCSRCHDIVIIEPKKPSKPVQAVQGVWSKLTSKFKKEK